MESLRGLSSTPANAYDELVTGQKSIRYHWQGILSVIRSLPGGLGAGAGPEPSYVVRDTLSPLVDAETRAWLAIATEPLGRT